MEDINKLTAYDNQTKKSPNFSFLSEYSALLAQCTMQAESYVFDDPNTALIKMRQFGEFLAHEIAARTGVEVFPDDSYIMVLRMLEDNNILTLKSSPTFPYSEKNR
jgi:type I restriction enzyme R subunit